MPIFIERYLLPLLATATFVLIILNPMKFDRTQQVSLGIAVLAFAYFLAHSLHQYNITSKQSEPTSTIPRNVSEAAPEGSPQSATPAKAAEPEPPPVPPTLAERNAEIRTIYNRILSNMRDALKGHQKDGSANIYIAIPDLPTNLFAPEASRYNGGATFSQHAAWTIFLQSESAPDTATNPALDLIFMNGDGHTVPGSEIGKVRFRYDTKTKTMNISSTGVGQTAFGRPEQRMSTGDFKAAAPSIITSLIQYQLDHL